MEGIRELHMHMMMTEDSKFVFLVYIRYHQCQRQERVALLDRRHMAKNRKLNVKNRKQDSLSGTDSPHWSITSVTRLGRYVKREMIEEGL